MSSKLLEYGKKKKENLMSNHTEKDIESEMYEKNQLCFINTII